MLSSISCDWVVRLMTKHFQCRGRAFAPPSFNSPMTSYFANARPSLLSSINCDCVVRLWAKHSQMEGICNFIVFCGNALPLHLHWVICSESRGEYVCRFRSLALKSWFRLVLHCIEGSKLQSRLHPRYRI